MNSLLKKIYWKIIIWINRISPSVGIPVLLYHSIAVDDSKMSVSPENFERQLKLLREAGYSSINLSELNSCFNRGIFPRNKLMITFDDGFLDNFEVAIPLLKKYGFGAVFFITGKFIGLTADFCNNDIDRIKLMMSADNLLKINNDSFEVANHFFSHKILLDVDENEVKSEYNKNLKKLAEIVGDNNNLRCVAFPKNKKGNFINLLKFLGVKLGFGGRPGVVGKKCNKYDLPRIQVFNNDSADKFIAKLSKYYYVCPRIISQLRVILKSPWFYGLLFLVLSRFIFFQAGLAGFPADAALVGDWWTVYGGDEINYFKSAQAIIKGDFLFKLEPIGFPLFLVPFIWLSSSTAFIDFFPLISFVNGVILYSLVLILIYFLAKEILFSKFKAYIVVGLFNIYPYLFYYLFKIGVTGNEVINQFIDSRFRQLMFWPVGSDPLSTVLIMAALLILILVIKNKINSVSLMIVMGVLASWAAITRLQNLIILPIFFFTLLALKKIRLLKYFTLAGAPLILFQMYVNFISYGGVFRTSYKINGGSNLDIQIFDFAYIKRIITYPLDYGAVLLPLLAAIVILVVFGLYRIIKINKSLGFFLVGYILANLIFISFLEPTFRNPRYFLPIIPLLIIIIYIPFEEVTKNIMKYVRSK